MSLPRMLYFEAKNTVFLLAVLEFSSSFFLCGNHRDTFAQITGSRNSSAILNLFDRFHEGFQLIPIQGFFNKEAVGPILNGSLPVFR